MKSTQSIKHNPNKKLFCVMDVADTYLVPLGLIFCEHLPPEGILVYIDDSEPAALFESKRDAARAISRTRYYRKAFGESTNPNVPDHICMQIKPFYVPHVSN